MAGRDFLANDKTSQLLGAFKDTKENGIKPRRLLTTVLATFWRLSTNYLQPHVRARSFVIARSGGDADRSDAAVSKHVAT
jgi:hypothetical protein